MLFGFILILALWATSEWNKVDATVVALTGISIMLLTGSSAGTMCLPKKEPGMPSFGSEDSS